jgi:Flp pilus assembly protein TadG
MSGHSSYSPNSLANFLVHLRTDQRGGVAVVMALLFPVLLAGLGLGFEISGWYLRVARNAERRRCGGHGGSEQWRG